MLSIKIELIIQMILYHLSGKAKELIQRKFFANKFILGILMCDVEMNLTRVLLNPIVYDKSVRPARIHTDVTNISFDLSLAQLIDVDEKNQIITTNQWLTMVLYPIFSSRHFLTRLSACIELV